MPSAARECPDCGHEFIAERRELQTVDGELVEVQRGSELPPRGQYKEGDIVNGGHFVSRVISGPYGWLEIVDPKDPDMQYRAHHGDVQFVSRPDPRREQATAATLDELIAIGRRRKMKNPAGWARHVMAARSLRSGKARVRQLIA
jgi:hypothetical protein